MHCQLRIFGLCLAFLTIEDGGIYIVLHLRWHCASVITYCDTVPLWSPAVTLCLCGHQLWYCASPVTCCDTVPLWSPAVTLCLGDHLLWHCASAVLPSLIRGTLLSSRLGWQTRGAEDLLYIANPNPDKENSWHLELLKDVSMIIVYQTGFCWCNGHWILKVVPYLIKLSKNFKSPISHRVHGLIKKSSLS